MLSQIWMLLLVVIRAVDFKKFMAVIIVCIISLCSLLKMSRINKT